MAALSTQRRSHGSSHDSRDSEEDVVVRAAEPGEGVQVAALWRELWDAHDAWGGYAASQDDLVYAQLAARLDEDARLRGGYPVMGRHVHLVASARGRLVGQVEGWFERQGVLAATPPTCEVRSLIVAKGARNVGAGRALLDHLARVAQQLARGGPVVLAAEVLEPNPAQSFYAKLGYQPVAHTVRIPTTTIAPPASGERFAARVAHPDDALALALLDSTLSLRRRASGDLRFDRPRAVDASLVSAIAAHIAMAARGPYDPVELVVVDGRGDVRASATLAVTHLDPPFVPSKRATLGRFAFDAALEPSGLLRALVTLGCKLSSARGAPTLELTDLSAPGTALYEAARAVGAVPWSRIVLRHVAR
jgi:GNAT superfamily N-acetyltransferase